MTLLKNPRPDVESKTGWCPVPSPSTGAVSGQNGQACGHRPPDGPFGGVYVN
eukprot:gene12101-33432_t